MAIQVLGAFTKVTTNGKVVGTSPVSAVNAATGDSVASANINDNLSGSKVQVQLNVDTAYADVAATLTVEASLDGTNWVSVATADADTDPNLTGYQVYNVDLTAVIAPYYRIHFNRLTAVNVGTSGKCQFAYCF